MAAKEQEEVLQALQCLSGRIEEGLCTCSLTDWLVEHAVEPDLAERMLAFALTANPQAMAHFMIQQALEGIANQPLQESEQSAPTIH